MHFLPLLNKLRSTWRSVIYTSSYGRTKASDMTHAAKMKASTRTPANQQPSARNPGVSTSTPKTQEPRTSDLYSMHIYSSSSDRIYQIARRRREGIQTFRQVCAIDTYHVLVLRNPQEHRHAIQAGSSSILTGMVVSLTCNTVEGTCQQGSRAPSRRLSRHITHFCPHVGNLAEYPLVVS